MSLYKLLAGYLDDLAEDYPRQQILNVLAEWIKETSEFEEDLVDYETPDDDILEEIL